MKVSRHETVRADSDKRISATTRVNTGLAISFEKVRRTRALLIVQEIQIRLETVEIPLRAKNHPLIDAAIEEMIVLVLKKGLLFHSQICIT